MRNIHLSIRISLLVIAVLMTISGYVWGDPAVIWQKAANICLECIGIG
ncbi:thioredoxin [Candidatus Fermentibacteria bacterium]|nr:MAG: thioredoxin [Candidatus Fermentibacteria bacterium]